MHSTSPTTPKPRRRWAQFSLRAFLVLVLLCGLPASFVGVRLQMARNKQALAAPFKGASVGFRELGGPFSSAVSIASIYFGSLTDADLRSLQEHLERQPDLQVLVLSGTQVTDAGLVHLQELSQLKLLNLESTAITDAGLTHLRRLTQLDYLSLKGTQVTDGGVNELQNALPNTRITR